MRGEGPPRLPAQESGQLERRMPAPAHRCGYLGELGVTKWGHVRDPAEFQREVGPGCDDAQDRGHLTSGGGEVPKAGTPCPVAQRRGWPARRWPSLWGPRTEPEGPLGRLHTHSLWSGCLAASCPSVPCKYVRPGPGYPPRHAVEAHVPVTVSLLGAQNPPGRP